MKDNCKRCRYDEHYQPRCEIKGCEYIAHCLFMSTDKILCSTHAIREIHRYSNMELHDDDITNTELIKYYKPTKADLIEWMKEQEE